MLKPKNYKEFFLLFLVILLGGICIGSAVPNKTKQLSFESGSTVAKLNIEIENCPVCGSMSFPEGQFFAVNWNTNQVCNVKIDQQHLGSGCSGITIPATDIKIPVKINVLGFYCNKCSYSKIKISPIDIQVSASEKIDIK